MLAADSDGKTCISPLRLNWLIMLTKPSISEFGFWSYYFLQRERTKEKAALDPPKFSSWSQSHLPRFLSAGLWGSGPNLQHFQTREDSGKISFLRHWKAWQARRQTRRVILVDNLYSLPILPCSFTRASCLQRELKWSKASCASSGKGSPDRALCPDANHKRPSVKSQFANS